MKIDALTTCVGEKYVRYLEKSLPVWLENVDSLTVVTDSDSVFSFPHTEPESQKLRFVVTDIFTRYGASFNKGAALSEGFARSRPTEWVLNFDADILPPKNWRGLVEGVLEVGKLFGCSHRYGEDGTLIPDADFPNIWGFFHLWHVDDPHSWRRPVFDSTCGHAGNYDHTFMKQWDEKWRVDLWPEVKVCHQGKPREHWFGRDPKNEKRMRALFTLGLWDAWYLRAGHITPPKPHKICIDPYSREFVRETLWQLTVDDPFFYAVRVGDEPEPDEAFITYDAKAKAETDFRK